MVIICNNKGDRNQYNSSVKQGCNDFLVEQKKRRKGKDKRKTARRKEGNKSADSVSDILRLSISGHWSSKGYYILLNIIFQPMNRNPFLSCGQRELNYM